jgi:hypothetical protein
MTKYQDILPVFKCTESTVVPLCTVVSGFCQSLRRAVHPWVTLGGSDGPQGAIGSRQTLSTLGSINRHGGGSSQGAVPTLTVERGTDITVVKA